MKTFNTSNWLAGIVMGLGIGILGTQALYTTVPPERPVPTNQTVTAKVYTKDAVALEVDIVLRSKDDVRTDEMQHVGKDFIGRVASQFSVDQNDEMIEKLAKDVIPFLGLDCSSTVRSIVTRELNDHRVTQ